MSSDRNREDASPKFRKESGLRILIVDDHSDTRMIMSRILKERGYHVSEAATVSEALGEFLHREFDLVISDVGLPDGSGHDLMREMLRSRPVKGIAFSGYGMESDIAGSLRAGFSRHLTKPLNFALLDRTIEEVSSLR